MGFFAKVLGITPKEAVEPEDVPVTGQDETDDATTPFEEAMEFPQSKETGDGTSKQTEEPSLRSPRKPSTPVKTVRFVDNVHPTSTSLVKKGKTKPDPNKSSEPFVDKPQLSHPMPTKLSAEKVEEHRADLQNSRRNQQPLRIQRKGIQSHRLNSHGVQSSQRKHQMLNQLLLKSLPIHKHPYTQATHPSAIYRLPSKLCNTSSNFTTATFRATYNP